MARFRIDSVGVEKLSELWNRLRISRPPALHACLALVIATSCSSTGDTVAAVAGGATALGGYSPTNEIEQIYYLGVFDPMEQIPQAVYRVRVRGQASFLSRTKFASGWVPAAVVDSLGGKITFDTQTGDATTEGGEVIPGLGSGRRMVVFGPEGFRESPRDHRLVLVMGASPEDFFQGIDSALGVLSPRADREAQRSVRAADPDVTARNVTVARRPGGARARPGT